MRKADGKGKYVFSPIVSGLTFYTLSWDAYQINALKRKFKAGMKRERIFSVLKLQYPCVCLLEITVAGLRHLGNSYVNCAVWLISHKRITIV